MPSFPAGQKAESQSADTPNASAEPANSIATTTAELRATKFRVRWIDKADISRILDIEHESFPDPWFEADLRSVLRMNTVWCKVATTFDGKKDNVVGYLIYELRANGHDDKKRHFEILNLAVDQRFRRLGCAKRLIGELAARVLGGDSDDKRKVPYAAIWADVSEANLAAHQFFRKLGFVATGVDWKQKDDGTPYTVYPFVLRREWLLAELDEFADKREAGASKSGQECRLASREEVGGATGGETGGLVSIQDRPAEAVADVVAEDIHVAGAWTSADDDAVAEAGELADEVFGNGWAGDAGEFSGVEDGQRGSEGEGWNGEDGEYGDGWNSEGGLIDGGEFGDDFDAGKFDTDA